MRFITHTSFFFNFLFVCRWHSFQVFKFNSIQFIFAMSGMEAAKMTIWFSKFNAIEKTAKEKSNITSALTYFQHFDQLSV